MAGNNENNEQARWRGRANHVVINVPDVILNEEEARQRQNADGFGHVGIRMQHFLPGDDRQVSRHYDYY